jgi:hypothetical protein
VRTRTATCVVDAGADELFGYLSRIENLPDWATEFARELRWDGAGPTVLNGLGEFRVRYDVDGRSGVIDIYAGPAGGDMALFPSRVVALPDGRSAYTFTMFEAPGGTSELFDAQYDSLVRELENVRRRFLRSA